MQPISQYETLHLKSQKPEAIHGLTEYFERAIRQVTNFVCSPSKMYILITQIYKKGRSTKLNKVPYEEDM